MKKRLFCAVLAAVFLLGGCRAAFPNAGLTDTTAPTGIPLPATTAAPTQPAPQFVEVWREGEVSQIPVVTVAGQAGNYTIAMDPAYFTFLPQNGSDLYSYEDWGSEQPVYYRIAPYSAPYDPDAFAARCTAEGYTSAEVRTITLAGRPATAFTMYGTGENTGYCLHYYLIHCGSSCYTIEARFSMEMYEGLFAIMYACFETFSPQ